MIATAILLVLAGLLLYGAYSDVRSYTIPNRLCLAVALLYPAFVLASPLAGEGAVDWQGGLMMGGLMLAVGFGLFATGIMGGGDAKLLAATALWAGPTLIFDFIFLTALAGGLLALLMWLQHRYSRAASIGDFFAGGLVSGDFGKRPMPYGVAIAAGGFYVAFTILGLG